jgi:hypothetical protein
MASGWGGSFAHALGTSARSKRQTLSVCPLVHRSHRGDAANHHLVRASLEYRGHLSRGSRSSRPLHPAAMEYSCHCSNNPLSARLVQPGGPDGIHLARLRTCRPGKRPGIPKPNPPLSMPSRRFAAICGPSGIRQPYLLLWGLSIRLKSSLTRSSKWPVMLPKLAKVELMILLANSKSGERFRNKGHFLFSVGNINHLWCLRKIERPF